MRVLIAPDKFKGSLTAEEVSNVIEEGLKELDPSIEAVKLPLADGGEGTLDVLGVALGLEPVILEVRDPLYRPVMATYHKKGEKAFIEMAMASGLQLLTHEERNCMHTTTYGTGELIVDAVRNGAREIYLFIGGSATNDAGIGMASALGYQFYDEIGEPVRTVGEMLRDIRDYDLVDPQIPHDTKFFVVTDVKNKFYGTEGAAYVYGPQKGANDKEVIQLDDGLKSFCKLVKSKKGIDLQEMEGAGAAGGMGGGGVAFLDASLKSGIDTILELVDFRSELEKSDLVITGEGKFDSQTLSGKVIDGVSKASQVYEKPVAVFCGISEVGQEAYKALGIRQVITLVDEETTPEFAMQHAEEVLRARVSRLSME